MNKQISKILTMLVIECICVTTVGAEASASAYKMFMYKKGVKVYREASLTKGKKHYTKGTNRKDEATQYQIVKMTGKRIVVRRKKDISTVPILIFEEKDYIEVIEKMPILLHRCIVSVRWGNKSLSSSRIGQKYMEKELKIYYSQIENAGKYYNGGYAGEIYMKNGEVVAVLSNGGD